METQGIPTQKARFEGVSASLLGGVACGTIIGFIALILLITGIGTALTFPLMVIACLLVLGSMVKGFFSIKGTCPYCGKIVISDTLFSHSTRCRACKKVIAIKHKKYFQNE